MKKIRFSIPGAPQGKQRARVTKRGFSYTPKATVTAENFVRLCFSREHPRHTPHEGPVRMAITAYFPIPGSKPKWWRELCSSPNNGGAVPVVKSPDWDNLGKLVSDALNQIAYKDDRLIFSCITEKFYAPTPRIEVFLELFPVQKRGEDSILIPLRSSR